MCENKELEELFGRFNYKQQLLNLASKANDLSSSCIDLHSESVSKTDLLKAIASVELQIELFRNHFPGWDKEIDKLQCDEINNLLASIERS